jgi:hypothetical protein
MGGYAIPHSMTLETEDCCNCGIVFAMPEYLKKKLLTSGGTFYCPNGHPQHYTKTEVIKLREMLEKANRQNTDLAEQKIRAEQEALRVQKELKRMKGRVHNGVCPCCNRSFENLQKHMKTKHPDQVELIKPKQKKRGRPKNS